VASSWSRSRLRWLLSDVTVWITVPLASSTIFVIEALTLKGSMPPPPIIIDVFIPLRFPMRWIWLAIVRAGLKSYIAQYSYFSQVTSQWDFAWIIPPDFIAFNWR